MAATSASAVPSGTRNLEISAPPFRFWRMKTLGARRYSADRRPFRRINRAQIVAQVIIDPRPQRGGSKEQKSATFHGITIPKALIVKSFLTCWIALSMADLDIEPFGKT